MKAERGKEAADDEKCEDSRCWFIKFMERSISIT